MSDADRLRKALDRALSRHALLAERAVTRRRLTPSVCRAIVEEFGLDVEPDFSNGLKWSAWIAAVSTVTEAILAVAEADDDA